MKLVMKLPIRCPTCNDVMLTEYKGAFHVSKRCFQHPSHQIEIKANEKDDEVYKISVLVSGSPLVWAVWHTLSQELRIHVEGNRPDVGTPLPYFEPDLSDYSKLLEKIKTYLVFS